MSAIQTQRTVMMVLFSGEHEPWSRAELQRDIAGTRSDPDVVADAIRELHGAGLLNITGELVTPTRAARKMDELSEGGM
ncbi:MAG TPA: hypothetical protein VGX69_08025 [Solirubrobacteraceae bacterium]|nr:hypothetical protein [Solirubrobacteraceae bacterium]